MAGIVVSLSIRAAGRSVPVSTLRSDATGYVSFDLKSLIDAGVDSVPGLLVSATQIGLKDFDVLAEDAGLADAGATRAAPWSGQATSALPGGRPLCVEFPIVVDRPRRESDSREAACRSLDLPAVQKPDLCDYVLSPHSFVSPARISLGGDCCEALAPSTLPVQESAFYRVVVRTKRDGDADAIDASIKRAVDITDTLRHAPPKVKFADVLDYRQRWYALGHSLGEIKYSLPLAPGESAQLAVIEWSRTDTASRFDSVTAREELAHWQKRDRTIEETIDSGLKESQGGWSWAGGLSSGMAYDAKAYGQYTGNWAAGGGTSNSWGDRDLEAESLQELHDTISQATSYTRSLNSTVIVQASQAELNNVQTRRVANHNHCHALTVQYYEVLRHFRLRTEYVGTRHAVLIPFSTFSFTRGIALRFRTLLEQALLDRSVLAFFDALVRLDLDVYPDRPVGPGAAAGQTYYTGTASGLVVAAQAFPLYPLDGGMVVEKGSSIHVTATAQPGLIKFPITGQPTARYDVDGQHGAPAPDNGTWPMPGAPSFSLLAKIGPDFYAVGKDATFVAKSDGVLSLWFNDATTGDNEGTAVAAVTVTAPQAAVPPDQAKVPQRIEDPKEADRIKEAFLLKHLNANIGYYNRAVWVLMDPVERRLYLEMTLGDSDLLAAIDDKPIAVSGNRVAFIYDGPMPSAASDDAALEPLESIVTLPTRGLFAEAQLGHCNSCEKRDVTRMWNWTEMTAEEPPAIGGIEPGPRGQAPTVTPAQLPSNVIQIAPTPAAPDPTGLAAALKLLATPGIFRDMSGLDEASRILGKLVDGTNTTLAEMVKGAAAAKQKVDATRTQSGNSGSQQAQKETPAERYDNLQVAKEVAAAAEELGLSKEKAAALSEEIIGSGTGLGLVDALLHDLLVNALPALSPPASRTCCALGVSGAIEPGAVTGHVYGSTSLSNVGYVYTAKAGILDIGHIRDHVDLTKYIYAAIVAGHAKIPCREGTATLSRTPADPIAIAQAIAYVDSWSHEIRTFGTAFQDFSAFSPEDLTSNFIGTFIGALALASGGPGAGFDAAVDNELSAMLTALGARSRVDTEAVIAMKKSVWWDRLPVPSLIRRNFDGKPWLAGMPYDSPPPAFVDPATLTPRYAEFDYESLPVATGSKARLADFASITAGFRVPFAAAGTDRP